LKAMLSSGKVDMSLLQGDGDDDMTEDGKVLFLKYNVSVGYRCL